MHPRRPTLVVAAGSFAAALALAGCGGSDFGLGSSRTAKLSASVSGADPAAGPSAAADASAANAEDDADAADDADGEGGPDAGTDGSGDSAVPGDGSAGPADSSPDADTGATGDIGDTDDTGNGDTGAEPGPGSPGLVTDRLTAKKVPRMGGVVTDATGWVLYRFDKDSRAESNCTGDCARVWPPVLADQTLELSGIGTAEVSTIERADGGRQVTIGGRPVYRYIGDTEPGTWKGQNVASDWFAVQKDGARNLTCLPDPPPKAVKPPADSPGY